MIVVKSNQNVLFCDKQQHTEPEHVDECKKNETSCSDLGYQKGKCCVSQLFCVCYCSVAFMVEEVRV